MKRITSAFLILIGCSNDADASIAPIVSSTDSSNCQPHTNNRINSGKCNRYRLNYRIFLNFIVPISIGTMIYLIYRNQTLHIFSWLGYFGLNGAVEKLRDSMQKIKLPYWAIYSLPDGIWVYSGTWAMKEIWRSENSKNAIIWITLPLISSVMAEIGQYYGIISGAFAVLDMIFIVFGYALCITLTTRRA